MPSPSTPASLCIADDATFWPWLPWPAFAERADREATVVVLPVAGFADDGLGAPLDAGETVLLAVLRAAAAEPALPAGRLLVLPPLRFVLGPEPGCAFPVDPPVAHAALEEWCAGVAAAGFRRVVLYNASPWNEELCDAAARDIRIAQGLQMFCINLGALGLDFHPVRGGDRAALRTLLAEIGPGGDGEGPALAAASARLAGLLREIAARPPLPDGGRIPSLLR